MTSKMESFIFLVTGFLGFVNTARRYVPTLIALLKERYSRRQCLPLPLPLRTLLILVLPLELKIE